MGIKIFIWNSKDYNYPLIKIYKAALAQAVQVKNVGEIKKHFYNNFLLNYINSKK